jgi:hypothetical protein
MQTFIVAAMLIGIVVALGFTIWKLNSISD